MVAAFAARVGAPTKKLLLLKLADNANDDGIAWPSRKTLEHATELSRSSVKRLLSDLEGDHWISIEHREKDGVSLPSRYHLVGLRYLLAGGVLGGPGPTENPRGGQGETEDGVTADPKPNTKPPLDTSLQPPSSGIGLGDVEAAELQAALEYRARQLGRQSPASWAAAAVRRCLAEGVGPGELEALATYQRSLARADQTGNEDKPAKRIAPGALKRQLRDIQLQGANR